MPRAESMPNEPLIGRESQASSLRLSAVTFDAPFASGLRSGGVGGRPGLSFRQETGRTCLISVLCTLLLLYMMPVDEDESLGMNNNGEPALYGVTCTPTKAAACPAAVFSVLLCCATWAERGATEVEKCGNGVIDIELHEQCDDGNIRSGDGCSGVNTTERTRRPCQLEPPKCSNVNTFNTSSITRVYCESQQKVMHNKTKQNTHPSHLCPSQTVAIRLACGFLAYPRLSVPLLRFWLLDSGPCSDGAILPCDVYRVMRTMAAVEQQDSLAVSLRRERLTGEPP